MAKKEKYTDITTTKKLNSFFKGIDTDLTNGDVAAVYAMTALNHVLNISNISDLLDDSNLKLGQDIWNKCKLAGFNLEDPAILFSN